MVGHAVLRMNSACRECQCPCNLASVFSSSGRIFPLYSADATHRFRRRAAPLARDEHALVAAARTARLSRETRGKRTALCPGAMLTHEVKDLEPISYIGTCATE